MRVCTLASGSSGNSTYFEEQGSALLVDAGLSGKATLKYLEEIGADCSALEGILVTHEHIDHIKGVGILSRKLDLKIYATEDTWREMEPGIGKIAGHNREVIEPGSAFEVGALKVETFATSHDAADSVGFSFYGRHAKVGLATDTGYLTSGARESLDGSDLYIFEANHDLQMLRNGRYPWSLKNRILSDRGHLSNIAAGHCLASLISGQTRGVILAHLSQENNCPDLAHQTVQGVLREAGIELGTDLEMTVAPRLHPGSLWNLEEEGF